MVRRRAVIQLERKRKSEDRFRVIKWEIHINSGKRNYKTKYILGAYQDMQATMNKVESIMND